MEIPLISEKKYKLFLKYLPYMSNAVKIAGIIVFSCAIWVIRYGRSWSEITKKYCDFNTIRKRFSRWSKNLVFRKVFESLAAKAGKAMRS